MEYDSRTIEELKQGDRAFVQKTVTEADILLFAAVSTDNNPAHIDDAYACQTRFRRRMAHGMLTAGLVSSVLGGQLPGPGSIYVSQTLQFLAPVYAGDTLYPRLTVTELKPQRTTGVLTMATSIHNQNRTLVLDGLQKYLIRRRPAVGAPA